MRREETVQGHGDKAICNPRKISSRAAKPEDPLVVDSRTMRECLSPEEATQSVGLLSRDGTDKHSLRHQATWRVVLCFDSGTVWNLSSSVYITPRSQPSLAHGLKHPRPWLCLC